MLELIQGLTQNQIISVLVVFMLLFTINGLYTDHLIVQRQLQLKLGKILRDVNLLFAFVCLCLMMLTVI